MNHVKPFLPYVYGGLLIGFLNAIFGYQQSSLAYWTFTIPAATAWVFGLTIVRSSKP